MNLPIKFPNDTDVIAEEAALFRAMSPEERAGTLDEMFRVFQFLVHRPQDGKHWHDSPNRTRNAAAQQSRSSSQDMTEQNRLGNDPGGRV
jgi:hypothetical protein